MATATVISEKKWFPPLLVFGMLSLCSLMAYLFKSPNVFFILITAWMVIMGGILIVGAVMIFRHDRRWNEQTSALDYVACRFEDFVSIRDGVYRFDAEITVVLQNGRRFAVPCAFLPTQIDVIKYEVRIHKGRPEYRNIRAISTPPVSP